METFIICALEIGLTREWQERYSEMYDCWMCKSAVAEDQSCPALMLKDLTPLSRAGVKILQHTQLSLMILLIKRLCTQNDPFGNLAANGRRKDKAARSSLLIKERSHLRR
jgi:hypothetical protein